MTDRYALEESIAANIISASDLSRAGLTLSSGKDAKFYLDLKSAILKDMVLWGGYFCDEIYTQEDPESIAVIGEGVGGAIVTAAITMYSDMRCNDRVPVFVWNLKERGIPFYSTVDRRISRFVLVDDVWTTGGSLRRLLDAAESFMEGEFLGYIVGAERDDESYVVAPGIKSLNLVPPAGPKLFSLTGADSRT